MTFFPKQDQRSLITEVYLFTEPPFYTSTYRGRNLIQCCNTTDLLVDHKVCQHDESVEGIFIGILIGLIITYISLNYSTYGVLCFGIVLLLFIKQTDNARTFSRMNI